MTAAHPPHLSAPLVNRLVQQALEEDLGPAGDVTTQATLAPHATAKAQMVSREAGILCGLDLARAAFGLSGPDTHFATGCVDGMEIVEGTIVAEILGNARQIMSAERVALNFLNHMSGIASLTAQYVAATGAHKARICDTRKTTPGLRAVEKYAVKCGGGSNHRYGLDDAVLIKDNHIAVAGGVREALAAAQAFTGHLMAIEIEVDTLAQFEEALDAGARVVLLDNMDTATLAEAVRINDGRAVLEASGNVRLETVPAIAATGVDYISTSRITMAAPPLDIGLDIEISV